jgi:hypothetical protein
MNQSLSHWSSFVKSRLNRKLITLLLSVGMLFGSLTPPAVVHAHDEGQQAHDHHSVHLSDASHDHRHGHSHDHGQSHNSHSKQSTTQRETALITHLHVTLLGFEFTLPNGQMPSDDHDNNSEGSKLIQWFDREINVSSSRDSDFIVSNLLLLESDDIIKVNIIADTETSEVILASLTLCHAARCERSGVLLI